ncbi:F0F1 ATP synthase subunit B [Acidiphilium sp. AL]|uniref:ATP synthase subunit b n=1 Tax=Acidiphilium iwatense TaxID=768198 RepID=A0ABS9DT50_9PROT|nr:MULTISPECIES: F0F1 ATP synthase subunit B [Acidiphilium]MCF3945862.1 F0F1 ATP synthase subunit B [Acidiphilium iwatense]MCU4159257.1 F0F1 ATP synthase subunit B [Acidiphilium sp. AL]
MEYAALHGIVWDKGTFWVTIAVLIFLGFFGRKIVGAVVTMLDQRSAAIRRELDEAARLRGEAEVILRDAEARREAALAQAKDMLALAGREAERLAEELLADAAAAAKRREQMALERIAAAENAAVAEVREAAASLASRAAEKLLGETIDESRDAPLIDQAIAQLPAALRKQAA